MSEGAETKDTGPARGAGAVLATLVGLLASFGLASCCALPIILATFGLGTAWLGGIALFATAHRPLLLAVAAICLAGGALLLWKQRKPAACSSGTICSRPAVRGVTLAGLLVGFVFLYLGYTYV